MPLRPGETFGRYQLAELLGRGAMGEVYSAYDTVLHRKVALKVLTNSPSPFGGEGPPSTKGAARILREARAAAGITHPNAVSIYDIGEVDGVPFLAMELVAGRTLRSFIGDDSLPLGRRIRWVADVARALGAAHQLGLVHRDIKPENVMVRDDGFVKVLDFGIARRTIEPRESPRPDPADLAALSSLAVTNGTLTADGVVVGTPMYMAPEQMLGEALDGRTDQFAWGVLAHEVLTGKLPWDGEGVTLLSQIVSKKEVEPLTDRWPHIPERVDAVIRRALRKAPNDRFPGMEEIADALEPFATGVSGQTKEIANAARDPALAATEQLVASSQGGQAQSGAPALTQGNVEARGRARSWGVMAAIATVIALGAWGARTLSSPPVARMAVPDAAPEDVPSQLSSNPDATAAYRAGLQALRDGSLGSAVKQLGRARELDPLFGAAQLRFALTKLLRNQPLTSADLQGARTSQASLGTHDRILLDAFDFAARAPPDLKESQRQLETAAQKYPSDADFPFQLALVLDWALQPAEAAKALDVSIARDPKFAFALRVKGEVDLELDDVSGATEAFGQCLKLSPGATTCLADLAAVEANEGKCGELVSTARQLISLVPETPRPYLLLAQGLFGRGEPPDAVRAALQQSWDRQPPADRPVSRTFTEAALAILAGDFPGAAKLYQECERLTASRTDDWNKFNIAYARVLLDLEIGRSAQAVHLADGYLRSRTGLSSNGYDFSLTMEAAELAGGGITRAKFDELRDEWNARNQVLAPQYRWVDGYALPAETPEDAAAALAAKPDVHPLMNILFLAPSRAEPIGRAHSLAGRLDDGVPYLIKASASCDVLDGREAIFSTWASFDLGRALEERGDARGACAAYQRVIARWGAAAPPSRTAAKALARKRTLGCAPVSGPSR